MIDEFVEGKIYKLKFEVIELIAKLTNTSDNWGGMSFLIILSNNTAYRNGELLKGIYMSGWQSITKL